MYLLTNLHKGVRRFFGRCPECGHRTADNVHGYNYTYDHCWNCGWCTYAQKYGKAKCEVRDRA